MASHGYLQLMGHDLHPTETSFLTFEGKRTHDSTIFGAKEMKVKPLVIILFLLTPLQLLAQQAEYIMEGKVVVKDGDTYKYQLAFQEKHHKISGYSLTWLQPGAVPNKAKISGKIDKKHKMIVFAETESLNYQDSNMCFIQGLLTYHLSGDKLLFKGLFTGKDNDGNNCGQGTLSFSHSAKGDPMFADDSIVPTKSTPVDTVAVARPEPSANKEFVPEAIKITDQSSTTIEWNSDSCVVDIWDYDNVDGDIISVFFNGKNVLQQHEITSTRKSLSLPMKKGDNELMITAVNEGHTPPNIARLQLTDGKKTYKFTTYNKAGKSATILLHKN